MLSEALTRTTGPRAKTISLNPSSRGARPSYKQDVLVWKEVLATGYRLALPLCAGMA